MRSLSTVHARSAYGAGVRITLSIIAVLLAVPRYSGDERLPLIRATPEIRATPYVPAGGWPARVGALRPIGGVTLTSPTPAFGGFSGIALRDNRITLLSDGGNIVRFGIAGGRVIDPTGHVLRAGPGTGWKRSDRDSESIVLDSVTGTAWIGFENNNEIWRYTADFGRATARARPAAMRDWATNQGVESLARLADGRFVAIAERKPNRRTRHAVLFSGDPTRTDTRTARFLFVPPERYDPSDAATLPNGDLLILTRRFRFPFDFSAKLVRVSRESIRAGAQETGRVIATLRAPLVAENCEGLAITRERGRTIVWIVTDNDAMPWRPTYLLKFALDS